MYLEPALDVSRIGKWVQRLKAEIAASDKAAARIVRSALGGGAKATGPSVG